MIDWLIENPEGHHYGLQNRVYIYGLFIHIVKSYPWKKLIAKSYLIIESKTRSVQQEQFCSACQRYLGPPKLKALTW